MTTATERANAFNEHFSSVGASVTGELRADANCEPAASRHSVLIRLQPETCHTDETVCCSTGNERFRGGGAGRCML